jgi:hypothetical protein
MNNCNAVLEQIKILMNAQNEPILLQDVYVPLKFKLGNITQDEIKIHVRQLLIENKIRLAGKGVLYNNL